ncbi:glycerol-3-phosphate dehydrogenase/oxidase [Arcanobacterium urinimassiliense]|uniref:glycerol-3-phosphate dehydrogenase/oxidase n=1 Tax=Arcanobacterium urinimassiliense TaxID=1871014 RepID=UPI00093EBB24|nr:glycerol-3-phosphate dehydrogenase/oxidase [Arcanobacterium urinimassiliense]MBS6275702.1 glycerol-3-phosphate dehydrogenase/oxidase [Actinomycetaceae bacterium]
MNTALNAARREQEWEALKKNPQVDLLVIGGGITGAGIALDAATRGLNTVLVEKHDLGFGTSRWSSKLAHGGLRYLAKMQVNIAYHSACERRIIMENSAPHLVHPLAQVTPLNSYISLLQALAVRVGYLAGDLLSMAAFTKRSTLPRSRFLGKKQALELVPAAKRDGLKGAWVNYDGQMIDDARMVLAVARSAAGAGAKIFTYCSASAATGNGALLHNELTGEEFQLEAKAVINAAGVWAPELDKTIKIRPARGTHLVFDAETLGNPKGALTIPLRDSISRYLFILPADKGRCYLGLTDEDQPGPIPDVPDTPEADIDFLLENINPALERKLSRADIRGAFTGLRPLLTSDTEAATADLSRRHAIIKSANGLVSIVGGKFTEYRYMAEEALDETLAYRNLFAEPCRTRNLPLVGAPRHPENERVALRDIYGLPEFLIRRYGKESRRVVAEATVANPLGRIADLDLTRAEVEFAITHEGALCVEDILERRTRLSMIPEQAEAARAEIAEIFQMLNSPAAVDKAEAAQEKAASKEAASSLEAVVSGKSPAKGQGKRRHG